MIATDFPTASTLAGAFLIGTVFGFIACILLFRLVLEYLRRKD